MKITGKLISNPTSRLNENNQFVVQVTIKVISKFRFTCTYYLRGKVANNVYCNFKKQDKITLSINKNGVIYKAD